MRGSLLAIALVSLAAAPAAAAIDYSFRNRQVAAETGPFCPGGICDVKETAATGIWMETAATSIFVPPPNVPLGSGGSASASALQNSNLGDFEISMSGDLAAGASDGFVAIASSRLTASFTLDSDVSYVSALVATADVESFTFTGATASYGANSSGVLPAGSYSLLVSFRAFSAPPAASTGGSYSYSLIIAPEPSSVVLGLLSAILLVAAVSERPRRGI